MAKREINALLIKEDYDYYDNEDDDETEISEIW